MKPAFSFRLDKDLVESARKNGLELASMIEAMIAKELGLARCPYCGQKMKKKKGE